MMKKSIVRPETNQLAENALKEPKKKVGEVISCSKLLHEQQLSFRPIYLKLK